MIPPRNKTVQTNALRGLILKWLEKDKKVKKQRYFQKAFRRKLDAVIESNGGSGRKAQSVVREGFSELILLKRDLNEVRGEPCEDTGEGYSMRQNGNN